MKKLIIIILCCITFGSTFYIYNLEPEQVHLNFKPTEPNKNQKIGSFKISHMSGFYTSDFKIEIASKKKGEIYYTINGKEPKPGTIYSTKISSKINTASLTKGSLYKIQTNMGDRKGNKTPWIETQMPLTGLSIKIGRFKSDTLQETAVINYIINKIQPNYPVESLMINIDKDDLFDIKKGMYIVGDTSIGFQHGGENYFKKGKEWERECQIQYFNKSGKLKYTSKAGLSIHGLLSPIKPQKSLRLSAKKKYGSKSFKFNFFDTETDKFQRLVLRSAFSAWDNGVYTDCFISEATKQLNLETAQQKPVIVFINGEYWGIHFLAEKIGKYYIKNTFNISTDSIDICRDNGHADHGDSSSFKELMRFIKKNDLKIDSNYQHVLNNLDMSNMIDWLFAETFFQNRDWPGNNTRLWKKKSDSKWRNFLVDMDASDFNRSGASLNRLYTFTNEFYPDERNKCNFIFQNLLRNSSFRVSFYDRYVELLATVGSKKQLLPLFNKYHTLFSGTNMAIDHQKRWGYPEDDNFEDFEDNLKDWIEEREDIAKEELDEFMIMIKPDTENPFRPYTFEEFN